MFEQLEDFDRVAPARPSVPPALLRPTRQPTHRTIPPQMVERAARVGRRVARAIARRGPSVRGGEEDLLSAGLVAFVETCRKREDLPVAELEQLALTRLRYAMFDELRANDPLSRPMRRKAKRLQAAASQLSSTLGRSATEGEVAEALEMSLATYRATLEAMLASERSGVPSDDALEHTAVVDGGPEEGMVRRQLWARVRSAMLDLRPRQQQVLALYFEQERPLREIGALLGVSEARVSQLVAAALRDLRERARPLVATLPPPPSGCLA